nr:MAG: hypothetical protein [Molluscum contagiosum virus]
MPALASAVRRADSSCAGCARSMSGTRTRRATRSSPAMPL